MKKWSGFSLATDSRKALEEATKDWPKTTRFDLVLVFYSTQQNGAELAEAMQQRFPGTLWAGCSSTGEHLNGKHFNGSLVIMGIEDSGIRWTHGVIQNLKGLSKTTVESSIDTMLSKLKLDREQLDPSKQFCLSFVDGLSLKEEDFSSWVAESLAGVPMVGGSAGDDLKFAKTEVIADGKVYENSGILVLADSSRPFTVVKHQHFVTTIRQLVVTKVDAPNRKVIELDGMPALDAYAQVLGLKPEEVTPDICFVNPLMFQVNGDFYVRSIQKIEADGSLVFYCAIEEGLVLEVGDHEKIEGALGTLASQLHKGESPFDLFIGFNCILRALETTQLNMHEELGKTLTKTFPSYIAFDTYGEQLNGLHINQTLVGIAIRKAA